jgi:hypothetical protein
VSSDAQQRNQLGADHNQNNQRDHDGDCDPVTVASALEFLTCALTQDPLPCCSGAESHPRHIAGDGSNQTANRGNQRAETRRNIVGDRNFLIDGMAETIAQIMHDYVDRF